MKQLTLLAIFLSLGGLVACAHETTTMDRELALKLADRPQVIVTPAAPAPIVNVNNYIGETQVHSSPVKPKFDPSQPYTVVDDTDDSPPVTPLAERQNCINSPDYSIDGKLLGYNRRCFGGN